MSNTNTNSGTQSKRAPSLEFTPLEPMILMSAVPVDMNQIEMTDDADFDFGTANADYIDGKDGDDFIAGGGGNDMLLGGAGNDYLAGEDGDDHIDGGDGNDLLEGGEGNDTVLGGAGDDTILAGVGNDVVDGGEGFDVIDYYLAPGGVDIDLTTGHASHGPTTTDFTSIEAVMGSQYDDVYRFTQPTEGAAYVILAGYGENTIDLSQFASNQVEVTNGHLRVQPGNGEFEVLFHNVSRIIFADGTQQIDPEGARWPVEFQALLPTGFGSQYGLFGEFEDSEFVLDGENDESEEGSGSGGDTLGGDGGGTGSGGGDNEVPVAPPAEPSETHVLNASGAEDTIITGNSLDAIAGATPESQVVTRVLSQPFHGTVSVNEAGIYTYQPNADFFGVDTFVLEVINEGRLDEIIVSLEVTPVSDLPRAEDDSFNMLEDSVLLGNVMLNDFDVDGDALSVAGIVAQPEHGHVTIDAEGNFRYEPRSNYQGQDRFTYQLVDAQGATSTGEVIVNVFSVNDAPVAVNDQFTGQSGVTVVGNLLSNDSDVDGDVLSFDQLLSQPTGGTISVLSNGQFSYTPLPGFVGTDSFEYVVRDGNGATAVATVTIEVEPSAFEAGENPTGELPALVNIQVDAGQSVAITLPIPAGVDAAHVEYRLSGLPAGATMNNGLDLGNGGWRVRGDELAGLTLSTNANVAGDFDISVHTSIRGDVNVIEDTFDAEELGWTVRSGVQVNPSNDGFLGPFSGTGGQQGVFRTYSVPAGLESVVVEFDFLEGDSWDGERFLVFGNDTLISSDRYYFANHANGSEAYGNDGDRPFSRALPEYQRAGSSGWSDQVHRYRIEVPVVDGQVKLGFGSTINQSLGDESWAIDNLTISSNFSRENSIDLSLAPVMGPDVNDVDVVGDPEQGDLRLLMDIDDTETQRVTSVVVSGLSNDVQLNGGERNADGSITLVREELENLRLTGQFSQSFVAEIRTNYSQIKTLYMEDFENGAGGWSANTTQSGSAELTSFLGRFNENFDGMSPEEAIIEKTFAISPDVKEVIIEFDQYEMGNWEGDDQFVVFINGEAISAEQLMSAVRIDEAGNLVLEELEESLAEDKGFEKATDRIKHYALRVAVNGPLTIGFGANLDAGVSNESWGIDNLQISYLEQSNQVDRILIPGVDQSGEPKNLIVNGSFEIFTNAKEASWGYATQSLAGWALESGTRFEPHKPRAGISATDGNVWMDMGLSPGNLAISQQIEGVEDGKFYELNFDLADSVQDQTDGLEVYWNGEKVADFDNVGGSWVTQKLRVEGGSGDGSNTLVFRGTGDSNNFGVSLDNVQMFEVDALIEAEPESGQAGEEIGLGLDLDEQQLPAGAIVTVGGLPEGAILTTGTDNGDGTWTLTAEQAEKAALRVPTTFSGEVSLRVTTQVVEADAHNFIVNGSFEDTNGLGVADGGWAETKTLPGWKLESGPQFDIHDKDHANLGATDGEFHLDTAGSPGNLTFSQQVENLSTGDSYELTFDIKHRREVGDGVLEVYWNGELLETFSGAQADGWQAKSFAIVSGSGDGTDTLRYREVGSNNAFGTLLDNVQLKKYMTSVTEVNIDVAEADDPTNLIANGSFENLDGLKKAGFGYLGDELTGWKLEGGPRFEVHNPRGGVDQAADGEYWLDMDASPGNVTISQQVLGLENGKVYELSFATANSNPFMHAGKLLDTASNGLEVFWNGEKVSEVVKEDAEFTNHTLTLRAGSGDGSNTLTFRGTGAEDNVGISLDNIRMVESSNLLVNGSFENLTGTVDKGWGFSGKTIQGWTLEENGTLIAQENFENGAEGWSDNRITETDHEVLTDFLGKFGGSNGLEAVSKTFDLQGDHNYAVMEFDFLKLDSWDSNTGHAGTQEALNIFVNGVEIVAFQPEAATTEGRAQLGADSLTGVSGNVRYVITSSGQDTEMQGAAHGQWGERVYHVRLEMVNPGEQVKLGFGSTLNQSIADESFGIDNVTVFGAENPNTSLNADGTFSASGNAFEVHNPRGGVVASDGDYWLDMGGSASNVTIAQQIPGLPAGTAYTVAFDLADSAHDRTDGLQVIWNGEVIAEIDGQDITMDRFEFEVKAGSGDGSDTLKFRGTGEVNNFGVSLDDVTFTEGGSPLVEAEAESIVGSAGNTLQLGFDLDETVIAERSTATVSGVPEGAVLSSGTRNADGTWTVPAEELEELSLRTPTSFAGTVGLTVELNAVTRTSPEMIVNGSFEDIGDATIANNGWKGFKSLPGWTLESGPQMEVVDSGHRGVEATDGSNWLDMDATPGNIGVSQVVTGLNVGETYQLSFDTINTLRNGIADAENGISVFFAGEKVLEFKSGQELTVSHTVNIVGGSGDGSDKLVIVGLDDTPDGFGLALDNVQMKKYVTSVSQVSIEVAVADDPTNLIANGSFENTGDVTIRDRGWAGFQKLEGWTLESGQQMEVVDSGHRGVEATDGDNWLDMDASPGAIIVSQEVLGLETGKAYDLSFDTINTLVGGRPADDNGLAVFFGGKMVLEIEPGEELSESHVAQIVGGAGDGSNKLVFVGLDSTSDGIGLALDNVRLEPSTNLVVNGSFENLAGTRATGYGHASTSEIQGWRLEENATLVANEDFENGASGWSNNQVTDSGTAELTSFLGRFGGSDGQQAVSKTFDLAGDHKFAVVEFDFLKLDSWDSNNAWGVNERLNIFLNDGNLLDFTPEGNIGSGAQQLGLDGMTGISGNVRYTITSSGSDQALSGHNPNGEWHERVYHVRLEIVNPGADLKLGFGSTLNQGINDESFGIDNVKVFGADNPKAVLNADGSFSAAGNAIEVHNDGQRGIEASDGEHWLDLGGSASNVTVAQNIEGVVDGEPYVLSFDLADSSQDLSDGVEVIWNGEVVAAIEGQDTDMSRFEVQLTGGSGDGSNVLKFRGTGDVNNFGVSLDNVRIEQGQIDEAAIASSVDSSGVKFAAGAVLATELEVAEDLEVEYSGKGGLIWGDPHFVGDDGGLYDVQGEAGKIYNLLSDNGLQLNSSFKAWLNPGTTVLDEIGLTVGSSRIQVEAFQAPTFDGIEVSKGQSIRMDNVEISFDGKNTVVKTDEYTMVMKSRNSGGVEHMDIQLIPTNPFSDKVAPHGLWGLTVDADTQARHGDGGKGAQGGGAIDTVNSDGNIERSQRKDLGSVALYETKGLFSTQAKNAEGSAFFRFNAELGTGLFSGTV